MLITGAFAVDTALYFGINQGMRNAADAAALAAASELFLNSNQHFPDRKRAAMDAAHNIAGMNMGNKLDDSDIEFGYVDPISGQYNPEIFHTPTNNPAFASTGGYNAVRVTVHARQTAANSPIPAIFSRVLGFSNFDSSSSAVGVYGGGVAQFSGLRPVYMCRTAWDRALQVYGDPTIPEITFYGDTLRVGNHNVNMNQSCGRMGPGNWGLADLANGNGAPGASTVREWFENGYQGQVFTGKNYESQTGTPLHSFDDQLTKLKNNKTVELIR